MQLNINIEIADEATQGDVVAAILEASKRAADHVSSDAIPEIDGDQVDVGALQAVCAVPRSFDAVFYRNA